MLATFGALIALVGCDQAQVSNDPQQTPIATLDAALPSPTPPGQTSTSEAANVIATGTRKPAATSLATPATVVAPRETEYVVQEGDTLGGIAEQFDTTIDALMEVNNLDSAEIIFVGQTLKVITPGDPGGVAQPTAGAVGGVTRTAGPEQSITAVGMEPTPFPEPTDVAQPVGTVTAPTSPAATSRRTPVVVNGRTYDAYNPAVIKKGQWYHYTCEFDSAWIVLKTYGFDVGLEEQVKIIGLDKSIEPYYKETAKGTVIYGGDVTKAYSGDYKTNFLARSSGQAMRKVFDYYGLNVTVVRDRPSLEAALLDGALVWIKATVDFKPWKVATWIMPDGRSYETVLGNDHALVVMGFNKNGVVMRDPLGPTSTGWQRKYEYDVPWPKFMASWGAQQFDGLAVKPAE